MMTLVRAPGWLRRLAQRLRAMGGRRSHPLGDWLEALGRPSQFPHSAHEIRAQVPPDCRCAGTGTILVEGPCDAAPQEAPCSCVVPSEYQRERRHDLAADARAEAEWEHDRA